MIRRTHATAVALLAAVLFAVSFLANNLGLLEQSVISELTRFGYLILIVSLVLIFVSMRRP